MNYNYSCRCQNVDLAGLLQKFPEISHKPFFASTATYVSSNEAIQMQNIIEAVESVIRLPAYQQAIMQKAPTIASQQPYNPGVFMGYDFHLTAQGPKLIEINTNAGGAALSGLLASVYRPCCVQSKKMFDLALFKQKLLAMFRQEWNLQRGFQPLTAIAIVDDVPQQQFLYPEFTLFQQWFAQDGLQAVILNPQQLTLKNGSLWFDDRKIDLVYNRLTDFYFTNPAHAVLARAYSEDAVVITPHPHAHALYADKRNLVLLSDEAQLRAWQVAEPIMQTLQQGIPQTKIVTKDKAEQLWQQRKRLFFKPISGYGSKGTYRGEGITYKVFNEIINRDYIAQEFAPPSDRYIQHEGEVKVFKVDIRNYVYQGNIQLMTARLYRGQVTNFRTLGGGFSPVVLY